MKYIQDPDTLEYIPKEKYFRKRAKTHNVMGDIEPYRSIVTDELISGRAAHREHLRVHGMQEVGNEMPKWLREQKYRRKHGDYPDG